MINITDSNNYKKVLSTVSINSIAKKFITLSREGYNHWGDCIFCESISGFYIRANQNTGIETFTCISCNLTGDVIDFISIKQNISRPEALKMLMENNNIDTSEISANYFGNWKLLKKHVDKGSNVINTLECTKCGYIICRKSKFFNFMLCAHCEIIKKGINVGTVFSGYKIVSFDEGKKIRVACDNDRCKRPPRIMTLCRLLTKKNGGCKRCVKLKPMGINMEIKQNQLEIIKNSGKSFEDVAKVFMALQKGLIEIIDVASLEVQDVFKDYENKAVEMEQKYLSLRQAVDKLKGI